MVEDAAVFSTLAACFAPVDEREWAQLTDAARWAEFLDGARRLMQESRGFGQAGAPAKRRATRCPLQEFLSAGEVNALYCPPTHAEKAAFAARHFTGGLPQSALPVESLYAGAKAGAPGDPDLFDAAGGRYLGPSARYMQALLQSMGIAVPAGFSAWPDHVSLELEVAAALLRAGAVADARLFLGERFGWLTAYRMRLLSLGGEARFYMGLIDVLLGICAEQASDGAAAPGAASGDSDEKTRTQDA